MKIQPYEHTLLIKSTLRPSFYFRALTKQPRAGFLQCDTPVTAGHNRRTGCGQQFFSDCKQQHEELKGPRVAEGGGVTVTYYSNEIRSSRWQKKGQGLAAESSLLSTSVISVNPWPSPKFKGSQPSWQLSLAYFNEQLWRFISFLSEDCTVAVKHQTLSRVEGINDKPPHLSQGNSSISLLPHAPVQQHAAMLPHGSLNFISIFTLLRTDERTIFDLTHCAGRWSCLLGPTPFQKTGFWVSFSDVPCSAVLLDRTGPRIWRQQLPCWHRITSTHSRRGIWSEVECNKT